MPPGKEEFANFATHLEAELARLGVEVVAGREATAADVADGRFDAVIVAAGALPAGHVVVLGNELVTWEAATFLDRAGARVTLLTDRSAIARGAGAVFFRVGEEQLRDSAVRVLVRARLRAIEAGGVAFEQGGIPDRLAPSRPSSSRASGSRTRRSRTSCGRAAWPSRSSATRVSRAAPSRRRTRRSRPPTIFPDALVRRSTPALRRHDGRPSSHARRGC